VRSKTQDKSKAGAAKMVEDEEFKKPKDLIDLVVKHNLKLVIDPQVKVSDYIVKICGQEKDSYLLYKKKNFLNNQEKTQKDVIDKIYSKIK